MMAKTSEFLTINEVAEALDVTDRTVRRWIQSGQLVAHRFGHVVRIGTTDFETFLRQHRSA
jgi:excisionase family DNA binding protein